MTNIDEIPVAGHLSDGDREFLRSVGFDGRVLLQLPVDGPFTREQVQAMARAGSLEHKVDLIHALPVDGPFSPEAVVELIEHPDLDRVVDAVHSLPVDGPVTTRQVLEIARGQGKATG